MAAALVLAAAASAAGAQDARIVTQPYKEAEVVRLDGKLGVQATIGFGEGEQIENVAVGDADKWQITPNKRADLLFVKPLDPAARTNMTVVTDRRTYFFDLVASPTAKPVYMLRFTYTDAAPAPPIQSTQATRSAPAPGPGLIALPDDPPPPSAGSAPAPARPALSTLKPTPPAPRSAPVAADLASSAADPAMLNFAWRRKGAAKLIPARVYDDGAATYLLWGDEQDIPQILLRGPDGAEKPAEFAIRGNTIVLAGAPGVIVLRGGKASATLENMRSAAQALPAPPAVAVSGGSTAPAPAN